MKVPFIKTKDSKFAIEKQAVSLDVGVFMHVTHTPNALYQGSIACRFSEDTIGFWRKYQLPNGDKEVLAFDLLKIEDVKYFVFVDTEQVSIGMKRG